MARTTLCILLVITAACESIDEAGSVQTPGADGGGASIPAPLEPGGGSWSTASVTCRMNSDCNQGEVCEGGLCQMSRCAGNTYRSNAPLGGATAFFRDREIAVVDGSRADGQFWMDSYELSGSVITEAASKSFPVGASAARDVVGGAFFGVRPESLAASFDGKTSVLITKGPGATTTLELHFVPLAMAAGDINGDKLDELIALSAAGEIDVCDVVATRCTKYTFPTRRTGIDIAAGDTDGDGVDEVLLLLAATDEDQTTLVAWNLDASTDGRPGAVEVVIDAKLGAVAAGDLDGDGTAEIAALEDRGWLGLASDKINVYSALAGRITPLTAAWLNGDSIDVAIGDTDGDRKQELATLDDDKVHVYRYANQQLTSVAASAPVNTSDPRRLTFADLDGDSPSGKLLTGPELLSTTAVPTMVVTFPPYDREHATGKPFVELGEQHNTMTTLTDSVSLTLGVSVGYEAGVDGVFKASVGAALGAELTKSRANAITFNVGSRLFAEPEPDVHGYEYGAVVLSCGCFHSYTYVLDDPRGKMGGNGKKIKILVPVGGQTTLWSTPRYNALAAARGDLPHIDVKTRIGDVSSYPMVPTALDGQRLLDVDLVFPDPPSFTASDVGTVGWTMSTGEQETNETAMSASLTLSAGVNVGGFEVGVSVGAGLGRSYAVSVGSEAIFSGGIPPIHNNPGTPEDEYRLFRYSFRPVIYKQHYKDKGNNDAAFYVMTYQVER